jgi:hypothetical protein
MDMIFLLVITGTVDVAVVGTHNTDGRWRESLGTAEKSPKNFQRLGR